MSRPWPATLSWNVAVEKGFGPNQSLTATYVGSHGTRLLREDVFSNTPTASPTVFVTHNGDWSNYNALQMQFQRRMSRGLQLLASYAWAHALDTGSLDNCGCTTTNMIHSVNPALDYASSSFDIRNAASLAFAYQIPWKKSDRLSSTLLGNWGYSESGAPVRRSRSPFTRMIVHRNSVLTLRAPTSFLACRFIFQAARNLTADS